MSHGDDVRPVQVAVHQDKIILCNVGAEVARDPLELSSRCWFENNWSLGLDGNESCHCLHARIMLSTSLSMPGQYNARCAFNLVCTVHWCDSCSCLKMSFRIVDIDGMTRRQPHTMRL